jgi:hypothetical protein
MLVGYTNMPSTRLPRLVGILPFQENPIATMARLMVKFGIVERAAAIHASTKGVGIARG